MGESWNPLYSSIIHSTIWDEPDHVRLVWITMLAMAGRDACVRSSVPGLARAARVTVPQVEAALEKLAGPDRYSRTPDHEGRRIEPCEGGWMILNLRKKQDSQREAATDRQRKKRQRDREAPVTDVTRDSVTSREVSRCSASVSVSDPLYVSSLEDKALPSTTTTTEPAPPPPPPSPEDVAAAELADWWASSHPWWAARPGQVASHKASWAKAFKLLLTRDGRTVEQVRALGERIFADHDETATAEGRFPGWRDNCVSPAKLRGTHRKSGKAMWDMLAGQLAERSGGRPRRRGHPESDLSIWAAQQDIDFSRGIDPEEQDI